MEGWVRLDRRQVQQLPRDAKQLFLRYGLDQDFDQIIGPVDIRYVTTPDNFINHSCDPNLRYDVFGNVVAAHSIAKGAEVFIDYGCFIVNFDEPFACSCGSHNCRGRIRRQDWKKLAITYGMNMPRFLHSRIARALKNDRDDRRYRRTRQASSGNISPRRLELLSGEAFRGAVPRRAAACSRRDRSRRARVCSARTNGATRRSGGISPRCRRNR